MRLDHTSCGQMTNIVVSCYEKVQQSHSHIRMSCQPGHRKGCCTANKTVTLKVKAGRFVVYSPGD